MQGPDGAGDGLEQVHEGGAAGSFGIEAVEFVAEAGQAGDEGGDKAAVAEAGAFPSFDDGDGGGGADAGVAEGEGGAEGAFGLGAVPQGEAVAPGGLRAVGFDDGVHGGVAAGQQEAVHAVAAGADEGGRLFFHEKRKAREGFIEAGPVPAGGDEDAPGAARLPGGFSHGAGDRGVGAGCRVPGAWRT